MQFSASQMRYKNQPQSAEAVWQFARACFDLAEFATNSAQQAEITIQGIDACRQLLSREPRSAVGHYYLGMDLGQLAQTRGLGALKLADEMEREFNQAGELDPHLDYDGPDRNLGLLYRDNSQKVLTSGIRVQNWLSAEGTNAKPAPSTPPRWTAHSCRPPVNPEPSRRRW